MWNGEGRERHRGQRPRPRIQKEPRAVDGIDISVAPGEIYGFLGPNGAGKSTTVHVLTTLLPPTAGTALVGGYDVVKDGSKIRGLIGVALQRGIQPLLNARDPRSPGDAAERSQGAAQFARGGVDPPRGARRRRRSQGLQLLGRNEAAPRSGARPGARPRILFLDEPTTELDPRADQHLERVTLMRREAGVTVFLTTQYLEEADVLADRVGTSTPARSSRRIRLPELKARSAGRAYTRSRGPRKTGPRSPRSSRSSASRWRPRATSPCG